MNQQTTKKTEFPPPGSRDESQRSPIGSSSAIKPFETRQFDFANVTGLSKHALEIHRSLYEGYVKETNSLLPLLYAGPLEKESSPTEKLIRDGLVRRFAFERNGMVLHELFFEALKGPAEPPSSDGAFAKAVNASYGTFDAWHQDVLRLAQTRGIGWVLTVRSWEDSRLTNIWIDDHSHGLLANWTPVLALDLWEHAYLLDFKPSQRAQYVQTLLDNLDWKVIESRCV